MFFVFPFTSVLPVLDVVVPLLLGFQHEFFHVFTGATSAETPIKYLCPVKVKDRVNVCAPGLKEALEESRIPDGFSAGANRCP